jgi:carbon monoxide dehydrogenase subunit G
VLIENGFEVPADVERTWAYLLDVEKVAACAPGAEITETVDDSTWKGRINMRFGPVSLSFVGTVTMQERDEQAHRVKLVAKGQETKGKGAATASVTSWLEPGDGVTNVKMQADIALSGSVAQLSRGLLPDISAKLTREFAECLRTRITAEASGETAASPEAVPVASPGPGPRPEAIGGLRLGLWAVWRAIVRFFSRLFGRKGS